MHPRTLVLAASLTACAGADDPDDPASTCNGDEALATCLEPTRDAAYYAEQSSLYFDTMDTSADRSIFPAYAELVARWEWPPWLKLTAFGREHIESTDTLLRLYPSTIPERDCRGFDTQPFGRCRVVFYYEDPTHEGRGCPIYEEFTFNDAGEITFIEAWSDVPGLIPMGADDPWAERTDNGRLATRIPGLGTPEGRVDVNGEAMTVAAEGDPDIADFVTRANDWTNTWMAELEAAGDDMWERGCGW